MSEGTPEGRRKMKKTLLCAACVVLCCFLLGGCLQIRERGSGVESGEKTTAAPTGNFTDYARVEAELAEQARQIAAFETRLAQLEERESATGQEPATEPVAQEQTDPESLYRYTLSDGYATVTSYLGTEETVVIPATLGGCPVVAIGEEAFKNGTPAAVVIPDGVRRVDWFAFGGCYRLASVTLPESVVAIGYGAFDLCAPTLTFVCPEGSYAAGYAGSYGIGVVNP